VTDSPHRFIRLRWGTHLYFLALGYAILDGPTMPVVGEGDEEPNDTYVEQLVASAKAAVDEVVRRGVAERGRIAIGGHSYGAFMTANLLAHSDLFRAGIARSGAYNRSLTPFGFQAEERTFWQAPEIYFKMSPFMHAHKVNEPILLIHGMADNNSGTFPVQSERFYHALKGHGATVRLAMLPHESHGYRGRESVMHMYWEMNAWLEKYVKNASSGMTSNKD
jgi:dipeptidyl aminopeptidase/acylaminoacyl peptidase